MGGAARSPAVARNSGTKKPSGAGKRSAGPHSKKARDQGRTIVFVDETGCYLLPMVVKTYVPRGQTPVLRVPLSRDHLSLIRGIAALGWLHARIQDWPFR